MIGSHAVPEEMFCRVTRSCGSRVSEADGATRAALQRAMHRACVLNEVQSRPRVLGEELGREQVTLETIAAAARGNEVARRVHAALGERKYVIDGGDVDVERSGAVHAAPAAVTHHSVFNRALLGAA